MKKYLTLFSSFFVMLSLGGVYAWSIFSTELMLKYNWSSTQTQLVFGTLIAVFPVTMIFAGKKAQKNNVRIYGILSALFFSSGYILSGVSGGNFYVVLFGIGVLAGIGTGFGYLTSITVPVKWFPQKKGLITGVIAAGFGLAAVILSSFTEILLNQGNNVLKIFILIGIIYGLIIFTFSLFIYYPQKNNIIPEKIEIISFLKNNSFYKLVLGIFLGTFAGLLVIGSLKPIGFEYNISNHHLAIAVSVFALSNFTGRLVWGFLSDFFDGDFTIFLSLLFQSVFILLISNSNLESSQFIYISAGIGFGFGANFVLFAKETSHKFGIDRLSAIYPYVFLGYAFAGIFGPLTGGILYDINNSYYWGIIVAALVSAFGSMIFLFGFLKKRAI
jgi:OFA family oxalate/formate antiporter-like MFS transporter